MNGGYATQQRGGTLIGFVAGLVVGLGAALAVAVYVTKVPIPFISKASGRSADQDATESQKNKDWNPNAPLYGKNPAKPTGPAELIVPAAAPASAPVSAPSAGKVALAKATAEPAAPKPEIKPAVTADPLGDLARAKAAVKAGPADNADPFSYFVQLGAFRTVEEAETQRAKLSLAAIETKVSEREQAGRILYRVRTGPYDKRDDADQAKAKFDAMGMDTALVRVQR